MANTNLIKKKTVEDCLEQANQLRQEGKFDEALDVCFLATNIEPNFYKFFNLIGEILQQKGDLDAAAYFYRRALKIIDPDLGWSYHYSGKALFEQGKLEEAIASSQIAIDFEPYQALFQYQLGLYLEHQQDLDGAMSAYLRALQLKPTFAEAYFHLEGVWEKQPSLFEGSRPNDSREKKDKGGLDLKILLSQGRELMLDERKFDSSVQGQGLWEQAQLN